MGLFSLGNYTNMTPRERAEMAISNLELYLKNEDCDYLLTFALTGVNEAMELTKLMNESREESFVDGMSEDEHEKASMELFKKKRHEWQENKINGIGEECE